MTEQLGPEPAPRDALMERYGITEKDADRIRKKIAKRAVDESSTKALMTPDTVKDDPAVQEAQKSLAIKHDLEGTPEPAQEIPPRK